MSEKPVPDWMKPLWVRLSLVILPSVWAVVEAINEQWMWAALFGAAGVWGAYTLIAKFDPDGTIR
ncbi:MAG: hypothetical protein ACK50Q_12225 [Labrys sp. (in: a-proteobacteria)]|jgi:hypothetical protein